MKSSHRISRATGADRRELFRPVGWSVVVTLLAVVALLWFLQAAISNERVAARARLAQAYQGYAEEAKAELAESWRALTAEIRATRGDGGSAAQRFEKLVAGQDIDSVLVYGADGALNYPTLLPGPSRRVEGAEEQTAWEEAANLENGRGDLLAAARSYRKIAEAAIEAGQVDEHLRAGQAEVRCFLRLGQAAAAANQYRKIFRSEVDGVDRDGRSLRLGTGLAVFEAFDERDSAEAMSLGRALAKQVGDYGNDRIPASQRRFAMTVLEEAGVASFPTREAEDLAAAVLLAGRGRREAGDEFLRPSALPGVFLWSGLGSDCEVLLRESTLQRNLNEVLAMVRIPEGARLSLLPMDDPGDSENELVAAMVGRQMPGWRISVALDESAAADLGARRIAIYAAVGIVAVLSLAFMTWLVANSYRRHLRRAQLKHDLAATISHELKTPLSSMRLLVDVLLEGERIEEQQTREYLELISSENARLSHLVENFLTYARIENHSERAGTKGEGGGERIAPIEIVRSTADSVGRRYGAARIEMDVAEDLPEFETEGEALGTALLNLADNACKYSPEASPVTLRCTQQECGDLCFEVADHGKGFTDSQLERAFESFERLDEQSVGTVSGCGLGLYIVRRLVERLGARLEVSSVPGEGSRFRILFSPSAA